MSGTTGDEQTSRCRRSRVFTQTVFVRGLNLRGAAFPPVVTLPRTYLSCYLDRYLPNAMRVRCALAIHDQVASRFAADESRPSFARRLGGKESNDLGDMMRPHCVKIHLMVHTCVVKTSHSVDDCRLVSLLHRVCLQSL